MKRKHISLILILILVLFNLLTFSMYLNVKSKADMQSFTSIYFLSGENLNWKLSEGNLILSDTKRYCNLKSLEFIGKSKIDVNYLEATAYIQDEKTKEQKDVIFSIINDARDTKTNLLINGSVPLGVTTQVFSKPSPFTYNLGVSENIYLRIKYITSAGYSKDEILLLYTKALDLSVFQNLK